VTKSGSSLSWSEEHAANGEPFLASADGNINLVDLPQEVFDKMGIKKVPFRLTPSMIKHVFNQHAKGLGLKSYQDAVNLIIDVMNNFDHVRKGDRDGEYWFTIESNRNSIGKRAITILLNMDKGDWLGIKTAGYERVSNINKREMLWEKGANETSATDAVPVNVTSGQPINDGKASGGASNQSISDGKGNTLTTDKQARGGESSANSSEAVKAEAVKVTKKVKSRMAKTTPKHWRQLSEARKKWVLEHANRPGLYALVMDGWDDESQSIEEYVLRALVSNSVKLRWTDKGEGRGRSRGLGLHLFGKDNAVRRKKSEWSRRRWMLDERDGLLPEVYAERLCQEFYNDYERGTDHSQEALTAVLEVALRYDTSSSMWDAVKSLHEEHLAEAEKQKRIANGEDTSYDDLTEDELAEMERHYRKEQYCESQDMTVDEYDVYLAEELEEIQANEREHRLAIEEFDNQRAEEEARMRQDEQNVNLEEIKSKSDEYPEFLSNFDEQRAEENGRKEETTTSTVTTRRGGTQSVDGQGTEVVRGQRIHDERGDTQGQLQNGSGQRIVDVQDSTSQGQSIDSQTNEQVAAYGKQPIDTDNVKPIGKGVFGKIYDQFKGKVKAAFKFLTAQKGGDLLGVFHRNEVGDIDLVWGDNGGGWKHILNKHVGKGKSFANVEDAACAINDIINNGKVDFENGDKIVFLKDNKKVTIRKNFRADGKKLADKNWVLTAYDKTSADSESTINRGIQGKAVPTTDVSDNKGTINYRDREGADVKNEGNSSKKQLNKSLSEGEVHKAIKDMGIHGVHVVNTVDELPKDHKAYKAIKKDRKVTGWYDPQTGKVYVYKPNINSIEELTKTLQHEGVAHMGLRELLGKERFGTLCDNVWRDMMSEENRKNYILYALNMTKEQFDTLPSNKRQEYLANKDLQRQAADEYIAFMSEGGGYNDVSVWQRFTSWVKNALHNIGIDLKVTKTDVLNLLRRSELNLGKESKTDRDTNESLRFREVTDKELIKKLESSPKKKAYRSVQILDGEPYSPMASGKKSNLGAPYKVNSWDVATEMIFNITPEIAKQVEELNHSNKPGTVDVIPGRLRFSKGGKSDKSQAQLQYHLVTDDTDVWARYNPYQHNSDYMMNDQFKAHYRRGNLVIAEVEVPITDLESGYKAPYAKDAVGEIEWKAGPVAEQFPEQIKRKVYLSRYCKITRFLSKTEEAKWTENQIRMAEKLLGHKVTLYDASFHPEVRKYMEKDGFTFVPTKRVTDREGALDSVDVNDPDYMTDERIAELNRKHGVGEWTAEPEAISEVRLRDVSDRDEDREKSMPSLIREAESQVNTEPTEAQKEAGNYKKGHIKLDGYDITIENPAGSVRRGVDANGKAWETKMNNTYGYIRGTEGVDGDHIDVFLANDIEQGSGKPVFVVDQYREDGTFDEHKVMMGFDSADKAREAYLSNYSDGWEKKHKIVVTGTDADTFRKWVDSSHRKTKAFADYESIKSNTVEELGADYDGDLFTIAPVKHELKTQNSTATGGGTINYSSLGGLPQGDGQFCHVERVFRETKQFDFTGSQEIKSADDVAYIFRSLEDSAIENVFIVLVKDNKPTVVHIGMGSATQSMVDAVPLRAAYDAMGGADKIYMVHNHPSGNLKCSQADMALLDKLSRMVPDGVVQDGIIINTTSGRYGTFSIYGDESQTQRPTSGENKPLKVQAFDKLVFGPGYDMARLSKVTSASEIAQLVSVQRLGAGKKVSYLILDNQLKVVGNIHTTFSGLDNAEELAGEIATNLARFGGNRVALYGDFVLDVDNIKKVNNAVLRLSGGNFNILDFIKVDGKNTGYRSAYDSGLMEPTANYTSGVNEVRDDSGEKSLVGIHNIWEDKLRKALRLGGLTNPSGAVVDLSKSTHDAYGDISFIMPSSMVDKRTGNNAGIWSSDAYTPRFPETYKEITLKSKALDKVFENVPEDMRSAMQSTFHNYIESGGSPRGLAYMFLSERGEAPETVLNNNKYGEYTTREIMELLPKGKSVYDLNDKELERVRLMYINYRYGNLSDEVLSQRMKQRPGMFTVEGIGKGRLDNFAHEVKRSAIQEGSVDTYGTEEKASDVVREKSLAQEFDAWLEDLEQRCGVEEKLYAGRSSVTGRRKGLPLTLENASKIMKKQGRAGAESRVGSAGSARAVLSRKLDTLKAIRNNREKLVSHQQMDSIKKMLSDKYYELMQIFTNKGSYYGDNQFFDVLTSFDAKKKALEFGVDLTKEQLKDIQDFREALVNAPTEYFEVKFERPVRFDEFASVVVPEDLPLDIYGALQRMGMNIYEYKRGDRASRREAVMRASEGSGIRFRKGQKKTRTQRGTSQRKPDWVDAMGVLSSSSQTAINKNSGSRPGPTQSSLTQSGFSTKVGNKTQISKNFNELLERLKGGNKLGAHELIYEIANCIDTKDPSSQRSNYVIIPYGESGFKIRVSNHKANLSGQKYKQEAPLTSYGVVIKNQRNAFEPDADIDYLEMVYYGSDIKDDVERQKELVSGIKYLVETGSVEKMPKPDDYNVSGAYKQAIDELSERLKAESPKYRFIGEKGARKRDITARQKLIDEVVSIGKDGEDVFDALQEDGQEASDVATSLTKAKTMSAYIDVTADDIKEATGWDRDNNGQWHYQIGNTGVTADEHTIDVLDRSHRESMALTRNLRTARAMEREGKRAMAIKLATGWERGADGMWRYEESDTDFRLGDRMVELRDEYLDINKKLFSLQHSIDSTKYALWGIRITKNMPDEKKASLQNRRATLKLKLKGLENEREDLEARKEEIDQFHTPDGGRLGAFIGEDNPIFNEYPQLRDVKITYFTDYSSLNSGVRGSYNSTTNRLWLSPIAYGDVPGREQNAIGVHEIQHAIQDIEGFASGGSTDSFESAKKEVLTKLNEITNGELFDINNSEQTNELMGNPYESNNGRGLLEAMSKEVTDKDGAKVTLYDKYRTALNDYVTRNFDYADIWGLIDDWGKGIQSAYEQYSRLGGEVESRNAARRINMIDEERRNSLAESTEDVARKDQVFLHDANPGKMMELNDPQYRFIGEKGAKRLDEREEATTRLNNLGVARDMETAGKDAKAIKMATGWERGADGKWRYETADFDDVSLSGNLHPERRRLSKAEQDELDDNATFEAYVIGMDKLQKQGKESDNKVDALIAGGLDPEKAKRWVALEEKKQTLKKTPKMLDDYIDDEELFTAYPELRDVKVEEDYDALFNGKLGSYNRETNTLYWNDAKESTLVHEVQHIIQRYERFAKGGNKDVRVYDTTESEKVYDTLQWMQKEIENSREEFRKAKDELNKLNDEMAKIYERADAGEITEEEADNLIAKLTPDYKKADELTNKIARDINHQMRQYDLMSDSLDDAIGEDGYHKLAGEVESRNAEARMTMTDEERRASLAAETEDVAREDQIFINKLVGNAESRADEEQRAEQKRVNDEFNVAVRRVEKGESVGRISLGRTPSILKQLGIKSEKLTMREAVLRSHMAKHGLTASDIADLPSAIQSPLIVYTWGTKAKSMVVVTSIPRGTQRITVAVKLERNGESVEVNEIASVHGKDIERILKEITTDKSDFGKDNLKYVDKEKAAEWLNLTPPKGADVRTAQQLRAAKIIKDFENPIIADGKKGLLPEGNDKQLQLTKSQEHIVNESRRVANLFGSDVEVLKSEDEIPPEFGEARKLIGDGGDVKGWYDPKSGKVYLYLPNATDIADAQTTVFHEIVGHKGLRQMVGEQRMSDFLSMIYKRADAKLKERIDVLAMTEDMSREEATEEYMARLCEKDVSEMDKQERSIWRKIVDYVHKMLYRMGVSPWIRLSEDEIRNIMRESRRGMQRGGAHSEGKRTIGNGLKYRFVGEKGAERLDRAQEATLRMDNLDVARSMEDDKRDAKAIKMATGWERGADGKWRYETADAKAFDARGNLHPERGKLSESEQAEYRELEKEAQELFNKGIQEYEATHVITEDTKMSDVYTALGMDPVRAKRLEELEKESSRKGNRTKFLDDYIDDDELFEAYPELRKTVVEQGDLTQAFFGRMGSYNPTTNTIRLYMFDKDVLVHEVQHAIQDVEGFARGGSASYDGQAISKEARKNYRAKSESLDEVCKKYGLNKFDVIDDDFTSDNAEVMSAREAFKKAQARALKSASEHYEAISGEVEARNAAKRMSMTDEERRASLASDTEDVAREDQEIVYGGFGVNNMGTRTDAKAAEIKEALKDVPMDKDQRAIVDVFTYDSKKAKIYVTREDGNRTIIFRPGNEKGSGIKHSLFKHYGAKSSYIVAEDIPLIPEVLSIGERQIVEDEPDHIVYIKRINGVEYYVATKKKAGNSEEFTSFYTKRKSSGTIASSPKGNTPEGARMSAEDLDATKVGNNSGSEANEVVNNEQTLLNGDGAHDIVMESTIPYGQQPQHKSLAQRMTDGAIRLTNKFADDWRLRSEATR
jgi:hypothetical protein